MVRGLNALIATVSTPQTAPVAAAARLRAGTANSSRSGARAAGATGLIHVAARPARTGTTRPGPSGATPLEEYRPGVDRPARAGGRTPRPAARLGVRPGHQAASESPGRLADSESAPAPGSATSAERTRCHQRPGCLFLPHAMRPKRQTGPRLPMPHEYVSHCGAGGTLCTLRTPFSRVERRTSVVVRLRRSLIVDGPISSGAHFTSSRIVPPTWSSNSIIAALTVYPSSRKCQGYPLRPRPVRPGVADEEVHALLRTSREPRSVVHAIHHPPPPRPCDHAILELQKRPGSKKQ
jgi:hypothetical protein